MRVGTRASPARYPYRTELLTLRACDVQRSTRWPSSRGKVETRSR
jgi:hypothetical protein